MTEAENAGNGTVMDMAALLRAVADENRLRILHLLMQREELCVCDIERVLDMTQTKVSRHLGTLRHAGIVHARRDGRWMYYRLLREGAFASSLLSSLSAAFDGADPFQHDLELLNSDAELVCGIAGTEDT